MFSEAQIQSGRTSNPKTLSPKPFIELYAGARWGRGALFKNFVSLDGAPAEYRVPARKTQKFYSAWIFARIVGPSRYTHRPPSSSFLGLLFRIRNINRKKELPWSLSVYPKSSIPLRTIACEPEHSLTVGLGFRI